jgi:zinc transport system permease protein
MLTDFFELFNFAFFRNALVAAFLTSISCGIVGSYIVTKRMVFISGGVSHASFGGIGIGYFLGINPILGAAVFSMISALSIEFFTRKGVVRNDSMIAVLWSFGMALGIIFIFLTPGYTPNLMSYLFGSILTVSGTDIQLLSALVAVILLLFILFYRMILFIAFDEEYIRTRQVPVNFISYLLICLIALTIVLNIRVVGVILVISLLTIPQITANLFFKDLRKIMLWSILTGCLGSFAGLAGSWFFNIPSGATIVFTLILLYFIMSTGKGIRDRFRLKDTL